MNTDLHFTRAKGAGGHEFDIPKLKQKIYF